MTAKEFLESKHPAAEVFLKDDMIELMEEYHLYAPGQKIDLDKKFDNKITKDASEDRATKEDFLKALEDLRYKLDKSLVDKINNLKEEIELSIYNRIKADKENIIPFVPKEDRQQTS